MKDEKQNIKDKVLEENKQKERKRRKMEKLLKKQKQIINLHKKK
jgi:hypothetical protein